jgi:hypothetical protein
MSKNNLGKNNSNKNDENGEESNRKTYVNGSNKLDGIDSTNTAINKTFDKAKITARTFIDETYRELPKYMQTITSNQERTVLAAKDIADNFIESQRQVTNSLQTAGSSFFDNYFWGSPKQIAQGYARMVSTLSDTTIATIRIWNNLIFANTGMAEMIMQYTKGNTEEMARVGVNASR